MTLIDPAVWHYRGIPPAVPLPFAATTVGGQIVGGAGLWLGAASEETTGAASARWTLNDDAGAGAGLQLAPFTLSAGQSRIDLLAPAGVWFTRGLRVAVTAGTVAGVIYVAMFTPDQLDAILHLPPGIGE